MTTDRPEQLPDNDIEEIEVPYTQRVFSFLQTLEFREEREPVFYLYKFDHPSSGKAKSFIEKYTNDDPPEPDQIGEQYGGGRYLVIMSVPPLRGKTDGISRSYTFKLHSRFDSIARKYNSEVGLPANLTVESRNPMNDMFAFLERIIALISPFLLPILSRPKDENVSRMLSDMYASANNLLQSSMADNFRMMRDLKKELQEENGGEAVPVQTEIEPVKTDYLPIIMNLLSDWLPKLIGGNPVESAAISQVVRATPQFQQLMADRGELEKIISFLVQTQGAEDTNKLLRVLKVNKQVPVPPPAPSVPLPSSAASKKRGAK